MRDRDRASENPYQPPVPESDQAKIERPTPIRFRLPPMRYMLVSPLALLLVVWLIWLLSELRFFLSQLNH